MSAVRAYVMWRLKPGVELDKDSLTYFSPGGYIFTHKSGKHVCFDFEESYTKFEVEDRLLEVDHKEIDNDFTTGDLETNGNQELIQEQYDIEFFKDGKIEMENDEDDICACIDVKIDGVVHEDCSETLFIEPVYVAVFDPYNPSNMVELYNKLTPQEYLKYFGKEEE